MILGDEPELRADEREAIVELSRHLLGQEQIWLLESINRPGNAKASVALLRAVESRLGQHGVHRLRAIQPEGAWDFESGEIREEVLLASLMRRGAE